MFIDLAEKEYVPVNGLPFIFPLILRSPWNVTSRFVPPIESLQFHVPRTASFGEARLPDEFSTGVRSGSPIVNLPTPPTLRERISSIHSAGTAKLRFWP